MLRAAVRADPRRAVRAAVAAIALTFAAAAPSFAIQGGDVTAAENALLPEYCPHTVMFGEKYGGSKEGTVHWGQRLGRHFNSMHHYCWALVNIQRATRAGTPPNDRRFNNGRAVAEIDYVLRLVDDTFPLMPEMLTRRGEALARLRQFAEAESSFRKAAELRPDYWPVYRGWAQMHIDQGRPRDAQKILEDGIGLVSEKRPLERMLSLLKGGK